MGKVLRGAVAAGRVAQRLRERLRVGRRERTVEEEELLLVPGRPCGGLDHAARLDRGPRRPTLVGVAVEHEPEHGDDVGLAALLAGIEAAPHDGERHVDVEVPTPLERHDGLYGLVDLTDGELLDGRLLRALPVERRPWVLAVGRDDDKTVDPGSQAMDHLDVRANRLTVESGRGIVSWPFGSGGGRSVQGGSRRPGPPACRPQRGPRRSGRPADRLAVIVLTTAAQAKDLLVVVLEDAKGRKSVHHQASYDCARFLAAFRRAKRNNMPVSLTFEAPPATGHVLEARCIRPDGRLR